MLCWTKCLLRFWWLWGIGTIVVFLIALTGGNPWRALAIAAGWFGLTVLAALTICLRRCGNSKPGKGVRLIYVNNGLDAVSVFPLGADGDVAPTRTIAGPNTQLSGVSGLAVDGSFNLYVTSAASSIVTVYPPNANGDVTPIRVIGGAQTQLGVPVRPAIDRDDNLFVLNSGGTIQSITVYPPGANGDVAPIRVIKGSQTKLSQPTSLSFDDNGNLFVTQSVVPDNILVFSPGAQGDVAPIRTIGGASTGLKAPTRAAADKLGNLHVCNAGVSPNSVRVFGANGDVAPTRILLGPQTGLENDALDLALDRGGNIYVAVGFSTIPPAVVVHAASANGNVSPIRSIGGPKTGLISCSKIAVVDAPTTP